MTAKWERRLAADGLGLDPVIDAPSGETAGVHHVDRLNPEEAASRAEYYRQATALLIGHKFTCRIDRDVWELHASGMAAGGRERGRPGIAGKLRLTRWQVQRAINRGRRAMGLEDWSDRILDERAEARTKETGKSGFRRTGNFANPDKQMVRHIGAMGFDELLRVARVLVVGVARRKVAT